MRYTTLALVISAGCNSTSSVSIDLTPLSGQDALTAVPLDSIVLRVSAEDIEPIEVTVTPTDTEVALGVPAGPNRLFELEARRSVTVGETPIDVLTYQGETLQSLGVGANDVTVVYRELGAIRLAANVLGSDTLPAGARLVLLDAQNRLVPVSFGEVTSLRAGTYTVANTITSLAGLRAPSSTVFTVSVGEVLDTTVALFRDATQCSDGSPEEVRADGAGCTDLQVDFSGLELPTFELVINGVSTTISAADLTDGSIVLDERLLSGVPYTITVGTGGGSPRQDCTLTGGTGVAGEGQSISIACGPLLYQVNFEVFSPSSVPLTIEAQSSVLGTRQTALLSDAGVTTTDIFLPADVGTPTPRVLSGPPGVSCTVVDAVVPVADAVAPLRVRCIGDPNRVYGASSLLGSFIVNDGSSRLDASGVACLASEEGREACFDASVVWRVSLPDYASCAGILVEDTAQAFRWICDDSGGETFAYSTDLLRLDTLLSQDGAYQDTALVVDDGAAVKPESIAVFPFSNLVENADSIQLLTVPNTIYYLTDAAAAQTTGVQKLLGANGATLVNLSTSAYAPDATGVNPAVSMNGNFGYLFGRFAIEATSPDNTINVQNSFNTVVADVDCSLAGVGISVGAAQNIIRDTIVDDADCNIAIQFNTSTDNTFHLGQRLNLSNATEGILVNSPSMDLRDVTVANTSSFGIRFLNSNGTLRNATLTSIGGTAVRVTGMNAVLDNVRVSVAANGVTVDGDNATIRGSRFDRIANTGITLAFVDRARIDDVTATNTGFQALQIDAGSLHHISNFLAAGTGLEGIQVAGPRNSLFRRITVVSGAADGFTVLDGEGLANNQYYEGLLVAGVQTAVDLQEAQAIRLHDTVLSGTTNAVAVGVDTNDIVFSGQFAYGTTCSVADSLPMVGLAQPNCIDGTGALPDPSTATPSLLTTNFAGEFVGVVSSDTANTQVGADSVASSAITNWNLSSQSRVWLTEGDLLGGRCDTNCVAYDLRPAANSAAAAIAPAAADITATRFVWSTTALTQSDCDTTFPTSVFDSGACVNDFLQNADEVPDTGGNGNGLCESGETCLYRPDAGAFSPQASDAFSTIAVDVSPVTGVTLRVPQ
ncbi:MAG: right-handed parallel beta-helix repeat-containing protein [Myxococcota bacterium]